MKNEVLIPEYLDEFKCIGSDCEDTCCKEWYISIDEDTYKKYKRVKDYKIKNKIDKYIVRNHSNKSKNNAAKMKLVDNRCAFLSETGLCHIHSNLGEDYLCNTCKIYPRNFNLVNGVVEKSLTLSCIEAAKKILLKKEKLEFSFLEEECKDYIYEKRATLNNEKQNWKDYLWDLRIFTISLLQNRDYTIDERLIILGFFYNTLNEKVKEEKLDEIPVVIGNYTRYIENKIFLNEMEKIPTNIDIQFEFCKKALDLRVDYKIGSERYLNYLKEMLLGLEIKEGVSLERRRENYKESYENYYKNFIIENEYILENYLVNYVFKNCFPIDMEEPFQSYSKMIMHYGLIKLHLIGIGNYKKGLNEDVAVNIIQSISKAFEHNETYLKNMMEFVKEKGYDSLANMVILIKN